MILFRAQEKTRPTENDATSDGDTKSKHRRGFAKAHRHEEGDEKYCAQNQYDFGQDVEGQSIIHILISIKNVVEILQTFAHCDDDDVVPFKDTILARRGDKFAFSYDTCNDEVFFQVQFHKRNAQFSKLI